MAQELPGAPPLGRRHEPPGVRGPHHPTPNRKFDFYFDAERETTGAAAGVASAADAVAAEQKKRRQCGRCGHSEHRGRGCDEPSCAAAVAGGARCADQCTRATRPAHGARCALATA